MEKPVTPAYPVLFLLTLLFTLGGILTLIPNPGASWPNILGYKSLCTFAPMATLGCFFMAGMSCTIRARLFGPHRSEKRPLIPNLVLGLLLFAGMAAGLPAYFSAKADAGTAATSL